jgi:hypothetical protein
MRAKPMKWLIFSLGLTSLIFTTSAVHAQFAVFPPRSATVAESHARGMADVIRSAGHAELARSEAAIRYEEARSQFFENRQKSAETYYHLQRLRRDYVEDFRWRPTSEQLFRLAKEQLPDRLSASQLDPLTGTIQWPLLLREDAFAAEREVLEAVFAERADGIVNVRQFQEVREATDRMHEILRTMIRDVPSQEYLGAREFIQSLRYEGMYAAR